MERYRTLWLTERGWRHQREALAAAPPELDVLMLRQPNPDALAVALPDAVFIISERSGQLDAAFFSAAPRLKMVLRLGSLAYDIDLAAARQAGVVVSLWPVPPVILVAEHVVLQMLALAKRLREAQASALAPGNWAPPRRTDEDTFAYNWSGRRKLSGLLDKTVGILGFGEIGAELARRLQGWHCQVLYHRRRQLPPETESELQIRCVTREELLARSDFVVNLLPYSAATDHSLGAAEFAQMKPGTMLCSCGSGSVIDETALAAALQSGHLGGAALDTFEWEPLPADNPLRLLAVGKPTANLLLTPHVAGGAPAAGEQVSRARDYEPLLRFLRGEPIPHRLA